MDIAPVLAQIKADLSAEQKDQLKQQLASCLNELLLHDFSSLVQLLYRVDVPEQKLKAVLREHPNEDAGNLMADLVIRRQLEKQESRNRFRHRNDDSEEERW